ncbi:MAG: tetratricopeptide repeat protein [Acidobacteria bacterium]|nr:tetratricopeptide repeat protein [Acidobacteriota bacterium]
MAKAEDTPRIQALRAKLSADPSSRVFYQLAEELRKLERFEDAEEVLRGGIEHHPEYLSGLLSLGRVLVGQGKFAEGIQVFEKALTKDPHNVVTARLLADAHFEVGSNLEAVKRYKLVRALHPQDEEVHERIEILEKRLKEDQPTASEATVPAEPVVGDADAEEAVDASGTSSDTADSESAATEDSTVTMGDLYASQGHPDEARETYRSVLERQPANDRAEARLQRMDHEDLKAKGGQAELESGTGLEDSARPSAGEPARDDARTQRLEEWLAKMKGRADQSVRG